MVLRTIRCECGKELFMGGRTLLCPVCKKRIHLLKDEPFMYISNRPVVNTFKFTPEKIKYFSSEYPKKKQKILAIYEDNSVDAFYWKDSYEDWYEMTIAERKEGIPNLFSWVLLTDTE